MEKYYDIAIIGAGPGGYVAAIRASQKGKKVALIEKDAIGGTCLNTGCIPTKVFLKTSSLLQKIKKGQEFAINVASPSIDFTLLQKRKEDIVAKLQRGLNSLIKANKIDLFNDLATLIDEHKIKLKNTSDVIIAENIIIATGSKPLELPNLPVDNEFIFDSTAILKLKNLPETICIVGGGYIGTEFASFFSNIGIKVILLETLSTILNRNGKFLSDAISATLKRANVTILTNTCIENVEKQKNKITIFLNNKEKIEASILLSAAGRKINTENLGLENVKNIKVKTDGAIETNEYLQTNVANIYAIGDVLGKYMLAHVSSHEAILAVDNIVHGNKHKMDYTAIPAIVFADPEAASVGHTMESALAAGLMVKEKNFPFQALGCAAINNDKEGSVQIIFEEMTNKIVGAHAFGFSSSELISEMTLAIKQKLSVYDLQDIIHAHPSYSEIWTEVAFAATKNPIHIFSP